MMARIFDEGSHFVIKYEDGTEGPKFKSGQYLKDNEETGELEAGDVGFDKAKGWLKDNGFTFHQDGMEAKGYWWKK